VRSLALLPLLLALAVPGQALAWGAAGHRMVGVAAMRALPPNLPAFLRTPQSLADVGELSREPDRSKGAGKLHDADRDPGHFVDVEDDGRVLGGPLISAPPTTRAEYEKALQAAGTDSWQAGYLAYSIVDQVQQLTLDFGYWRVLRAAERNPAWRAHRAWFAADRRRREAQILATLGALSHFVGDGAQPLHVSAHYNGWGAYPNPKGYTTAKVHGSFEGAFVAGAVRPLDVAAAMTAFRSCGCSTEARVADYLTRTWGQVGPFYDLEKAGGFRPGDPRGRAFAAARLGAGAAELRDLVVESWRASASVEIGWKPVKVGDVEAGRVDPYPALAGTD